MILLPTLLFIGILSTSGATYLTHTGHSYAGNLYSSVSSSSYYYPYSYSSYPSVYYSKPKQPMNAPIKAAIPVSSVYEVELLKPHTQMKEQTHIPLYIIPTDSLHIFPNKQITLAPVSTAGKLTHPGGIKVSSGHYKRPTFVSDPSHLAAIELPLLEPMVISKIHTQVLAPQGFTVVSHNKYGVPLDIPLYTGALLAPVPAGTIVSPSTPVYLNTIYAVQSLPTIPSYYPIFAAPVPPKAAPPPPPQSPPVVQQVVQVDPSQAIVQQEKPLRPLIAYPQPLPPQPQQQQQIVYYPAPLGNQGQGQLVSITTAQPPAPRPPPQSQPQIQVQIQQQKQQPTSQEQRPRPFQNSKESIYLQELREESIKRQIAELQQLLDSYKAQRP